MMHSYRHAPHKHNAASASVRAHVENRRQRRRVTPTPHMLHISPDTRIFSSAARAGGDRKAKFGELACTWWRAIDTRRSSDAEPLHGTGHEVVDRRRAALRFSVAGRGRLRRTEHCTGDEEAHPVSSGMRGASERALAAGRLPDCSGPQSRGAEHEFERGMRTVTRAGSGAPWSPP